MDEMENKLNAILGDPAMMQKIMSMASALGGDGHTQPPSPPSSQEPKQQYQEQRPQKPELPGGIDIAAVQRITKFAQQSNIDKREQALLRALGAYLNKDRVSKLEKAMRAAKIAKIASSALGAQGAFSSAGR